MLRRDILIVAVLALAPVLAHAPAWTEDRLLAPGDGTALHFPLRQAVWDAYARHQWPTWNPSQFCGLPLLASYRPGALYPPMIALSVLPPFVAFQVLVLLSLSAASVFMYFYLKRLHAGRLGAYVGGLAFGLGPYLVGHLGDTPAVVAVPLVPLLLLTAEAYVARPSVRGAAFLAVAFSLLLLAGSPEAAFIGALLLGGRILVAHWLVAGPAPPRLGWTVVSVMAGLLLSAPQLVPTLLRAPLAGPSPVAAAIAAPSLPGAAGFAFRYVSHTPAAALALAALPLLARYAAVRLFGLVLLLALTIGRSAGLNGPGAGPLLFDFALCLLAGLALGAQWRARRSRRGVRLRAYFLFFSLASAAALSISATFLGPLPEPLTGPVGVLAIALILYFSLAAHPRPAVAGVWLLPLTVSFILQPSGRDAWAGAATRHELEQGSSTRQALDRLMGDLRRERILTLTSAWPQPEAIDLGAGGLAAASGRRSVNGYDPMVPLRTTRALGDMSAAGALPPAFYGSDPAWLDVMGARWIQAPSSMLLERGETGPKLQVPLAAGQRRLFPMPIVTLTEVRVVSSLLSPALVSRGQVVARVTVRLATGRGEFTFPIRAGIETGAGGAAEEPVSALLTLPGRYNADALVVERPADSAAAWRIVELGVVDPVQAGVQFVSSASAYLSDAGRFREVASTPTVHLFERPGSLGRAWVVSALRRVGSDDEVFAQLPRLTASGVDPHRQALVVSSDLGSYSPGAEELPRAAPRRAEIVHASAGKIDVRAEGPGVLVVSEGWDSGWSATRDDAKAELLRVDGMAMAVPLPPGTHRVALSYHAPGLRFGLVLAVLAALGLLGAGLRRSPI